jgi:hypothetical protein
VVPIQDEAYALNVKATKNFWVVDTLNLSRYKNTDIVYGIGVKVENQVPTRIGQIAGVAAAVAPLLAAAPSPDQGNRAVPSPLRPFVVRVGDRSMEGFQAIANVPGWGYRLTWEADPANTVTFADFQKYVANKTVHFFPVSACIPVVLTIAQETNGNWATQATLRLTVTSPAFIRPYPLPTTGTVTLNSICGASTVDQSSDAVTAYFDDLNALIKAVQSFVPAKDAKSGSSSGSDPTKATGAGRSNPCILAVAGRSVAARRHRAARSG